MYCHLMHTGKRLKESDTPMNHPKVTVVGSANVDLVIRAERMPNKGETRIGEAFDIFLKTKV